MNFWANVLRVQTYLSMELFSFSHSRLQGLALRMRRGDEDAARALYEELAEKVFGFCMARVGNRALAEDLTQDIFIKLVEYIKMFDPAKGKFLVWFWRLARNTVIDHYRKGKETAFSDLSKEDENDRPEESLVWTESPEKATEQKLALGEVYAALAILSHEEQELFRLRYVAELSYREMSHILGREEGALRVATSRLKKKLQLHIRP